MDGSAAEEQLVRSKNKAAALLAGQLLRSRGAGQEMSLFQTLLINCADDEEKISVLVRKFQGDLSALRVFEFALSKTPWNYSEFLQVFENFRKELIEKIIPTLREDSALTSFFSSFHYAQYQCAFRPIGSFVERLGNLNTTTAWQLIFDEKVREGALSIVQLLSKNEAKNEVPLAIPRPPISAARAPSSFTQRELEDRAMKVVKELFEQSKILFAIPPPFQKEEKKKIPTLKNHLCVPRTGPSPNAEKASPPVPKSQLVWLANSPLKSNESQNLSQKLQAPRAQENAWNRCEP